MARGDRNNDIWRRIQRMLALSGFSTKMEVGVVDVWSFDKICMGDRLWRFHALLCGRGG